MRAEIENPFDNSELNEMFEKQRNIIEFDTKKEVKDKDGKKWSLTVDGRHIGEDNFDIWHDDYIVSFDCHGNLEGHSYAKNRFESIEAFKAEVFRAFGLTEPAQMTFF